ncbi:very long chain fatty acid elongase 6-like [Diadema antillarum]|uniref:very long chain fatty acid elongase 6-like n=1 Tax=Diadema antillarum TaxID=105358 RepID=UPI003A8B83B4
MTATNSTWTTLFTATWEIERQFDPLPWQQWMDRYGKTMWVACTFLYLVFIFGGERLMHTREKYQLRQPLLIWNASLAVFSMVSAWRLSIATYELVSRQNAWHSLVCGPDFYARGGHSAFWLFLFALSKVTEYGDTIFIVLRKTKLIFLHYFHHMLTFLVGFHTFAFSNPTLFISALMNVYVHSLMYSYYLLRILGVRVPKRLAMVLTTIQIIQLIIGTYVQFYAAWIFFKGGAPCNLDLFAVVVGSFGYGSVCLLFIDFFYKTYFSQTHQAPFATTGVERKTRKDK